MPIRQHIATTTALTTLLGAFSEPALAEAEPINVLSFTSNVYGPCRAHFSKNKMRFEWGMIVFLVKPPNYKEIFLVNPGNKCYRKEDLKGYFEEKWGRNFNLEPLIADVQKLGTVKIHGIECQRYTCKIDGVETDFSASTAFGVDPLLADTCCRIVGLPMGYGIPMSATKYYRLAQPKPAGSFSTPMVRMRRKNRTYYMSRWLTVKSVDKSKLTASDMTVPADYKYSKDDFALWFSDDGKLKSQDVDDFFMTRKRQSK